MTRGDRLREIRAKLGYNQSQAAELSGVLQKEISLLENDKRENIPIEYISWLGNLGVNLNWVFLEKGNPFVGYNQEESLNIAAERSINYQKLTDLSDRLNLIQTEIDDLKRKSI